MGEKPRVSGTLGMQHEGEIDLLKELLDATLNIPLHAEIGANGKRGKKKSAVSMEEYSAVGFSERTLSRTVIGRSGSETSTKWVNHPRCRSVGSLSIVRRVSSINSTARVRESFPRSTPSTYAERPKPVAAILENGQFATGD
jgi:hypothetical protein